MEVIAEAVQAEPVSAVREARGVTVTNNTITALREVFLLFGTVCTAGGFSYVPAVHKRVKRRKIKNRKAAYLCFTAY